MNKNIRQWICLMLCVTLAVPMNAVSAADKAKTNYSEVVMGANQSFNGRLVNSNGDAVEGAAVKISQNGKVVAETATNKEGEFSVAGLSSGPYMVQAGNEAGMVRLWEKENAPPSAKEKSLLVSGGKLVRGQGADVITIGLFALTAVSTGFAISNNNKIDDLEDKIDDLSASP
jgi:hypothetical protein